MIEGLKARTNLKEVSVLPLYHADRAGEESLHSFFFHQTHQDAVENFYALEMLKVQGAVLGLEIDAKILNIKVDL